ncbi:hypothetical protein P885DRAFT_70483 [Corynascus similis CBS 632.67]
MTRFNHLQHAYDYDYSGSGGGQHSSVWDTRTFIGVDNDGGDDEDETDYYSRTAFGRRRSTAAASVIGYGGDLPFRPRSRRPSTTTNARESRDDGGRDRVRIRPVRQRDATTTTTGQNHVVHFKYRGAKPQYNKVHALILTWSFHDLRLEDYTAPPGPDYVSLEQETVRLRATLEGYGYAVHEFLIPMHRSTESLKTKIKQFCSRYAADDTLLIIYYHGHGALDDENELVFSSERLRPVSSVPWSAIRHPILSAAADVLLVLDCCAAGGASLRHVHWQPPPGAEDYTKHLFAACGFESSTSDDMTAALCELMEDKLQKRSVGSQPIFKQLLPLDPEQYITLPNLRRREANGSEMKLGERRSRGRRGYIIA